VIGLKRVNSSLRNIHHACDRIQLYDGDLIDQTSLISLLNQAKPDQIYHLGALSWVTPSWNMPAAYMQVNAIGTINLLEAMRAAGCRARVLISATRKNMAMCP